MLYNVRADQYDVLIREFCTIFADLLDIFPGILIELECVQVMMYHSKIVERKRASETVDFNSLISCSLLVFSQTVDVVSDHYTIIYSWLNATIQ